MKTEIANQLSQWIMDERQRLEKTATMFACAYAKDNNQDDREKFLSYTKEAQIFSGIHGRVCDTLHQLEKMIPDTEKQDGKS